METKEALKILNRFVELGVKRGTLEKQIGLPLNSLASVLNGKREFPKAWESRVEKFISENTAPPIPEPMATILVKLDEWQNLQIRAKYYDEAEEHKKRIAELEKELADVLGQNKTNTDRSVEDGAMSKVAEEKAVTVKSDGENEPPEGLTGIALAVWKNEQKMKAKKSKNK